MDMYSIYPKQFADMKIPIEKDRCFVLMPFAPEYDKLYGIIKDTLSNINIQCYRDDEIFGPQPFMNKVITEIFRSRYLIVILSDYRPNVLYELGIAHSFKDVQNVLILIDKNSEISESIYNKAADLSHLTYIEYDINNTMLIRSNIREFVEKNQSASEFQEFLYEQEIITSITENTNNFMVFIKQKFNKNFNLFVDFLFKQSVTFDDKKLILQICWQTLYDEIDTNGIYVDAMIKLFAECLIAADDASLNSNYVYDFMTDEMIRPSAISTSLITQRKMDFAIYLAKREYFLDILTPWIIEYFKNTHSSTIDLNRYKLETFLITTTIPQINEALCNALRMPDFHIREHISDIIGEKRLLMAYHSLQLAIVNETNLYAGKSIIVALGKTTNGLDAETVQKILEWLNNHIEKIVACGQDFTNSMLTKSRRAIANICSESLDEFDKIFIKYITNLDY